MNEDQLIKELSRNSEVIEAYVLIREIKVCLNIEQSTFHPSIYIKIWKSNLTPEQPYHFTISHFVQTPNEGAYRPSGTSAESESEAIFLAISATTNFLHLGVSKGLHPDDTWLMPNPDY
jgi:hypothetical protein